MLAEKFHQLRNVDASFPQRRQSDIHHVDAVEKIFTESAGGDLMLEVAIGGADHARFRARIFLRANAAEFSVLKHLQKLRLQAQAELANFIEKERAAIGQGDEAGLGGIGSGECALLIAEELAFQ